MNMKMKLLIVCFAIVQYTFAQQNITGTVSDESGVPLLGASVIIEGTATGTSTDFDGNFSLNVPSDGVLVVSYTGYTTKKVSVDGQSEINIQLGENAAALDEVVITALGVESNKSELSYAVQTVSTKDVNSSRIGDISKQLRGAVPGLTITTNGGSGVSSSRIVLRGESSLNLSKNQPLIIVDGVPISNDFNGVPGGNARGNSPVDYGNGLTDINPDDIEDISVLKGPKAAALYGTRAANGALVIRTTSGYGKKGNGIVYSTGVSIDQVTRFWDIQQKYSGGSYDGEKGQYIFQRYGGWGLPMDGRFQEQPLTNYEVTPAETPLNVGTNPKDFFDLGISQNHHLSFSFVEEEKVSGRISLSYQDKTGIVPNTDYERIGLSFKTNAKLTDKLSADLTGSYVNSGSENLPVMGIGDDGREGVAYSLIWAGNHVNLKDYKGNYWYTKSDGTRYQKSSPPWSTNPYIITHENLNKFNRHRVFGNFKATYQFTEDLYAFVRMGMDHYNDARNSRRPSGQAYFLNGMYRTQDIKFTETNMDFFVDYKRALSDKIGVGANVGGNLMRQVSNNVQTRVNQLLINDLYNFGNGLDRPQIIEADAEKRINSVYGTLKFDYDKKVFLDVTGRNDWSSTLSPKNNSFFYPSLGLSGIISEMMTLPKAISYFQLRGSVAQTGNDTDPQLINRTYAYGALPGSTTNQSFVVDPNLKPERTTALEVGFDIRFMDNRLKLETNFYSNSTKDQILRAPISHTTGATTKLLNAGLVKNNGIEVLLRGDIIKTDDFNWDVSLNWSANRGEVVELSNGIDEFIMATGPALPGIVVKAVPGGRMGDIYGKDYKRDDKGNIIWSDVSGIATATYDTKLKKLGNYNPDWISGLTTNFSYKGINLKIIGEYRHGGSLFTETGARLYQAGKDSETLARETTPTVTPAGVMSDGNGGFVKNTITSPYYNYARAIRHWENGALNTFDASFFKLREISIGTDLKKYFEGLPLTKLTVSIFGRNLYTYTLSEELRHFDPESFMISNGTLVPGVESGQLPTPTTYGMNVSIGF